MPPDITPVIEDCRGTGEILALVGNKWSVFIVGLLSHRTMRFNELRRGMDGVSQRMLSLTLKGLERDGLVKRTIYPTVPPRVDYELTAMGRSLHPTLKALAAWVRDNLPGIAAARIGYDAGGEPHVGSLEDLRAAELSLTRNTA